jgi:carboxypeptidase C (cathepsin A)
MTTRIAIAATLLLLATAPLAARAQDKPAPPPKAAPSPSPSPSSTPVPLPAHVETRHTITLAGRPVDYRAIAETFALHDQKGDVTASVYVVSYVADAPAGVQRPVAFVFNGGPGAASVFLHLGALGPRVLETPGDGSLPNPPYKLIDNPSSWLAFTDLVFVDPVGTGFSRGEGKDDNPNKPFWNVRSDLNSLGAVVRLWLTRHERWAAPVYLVGESYGGYRVAALAQTLVNDVGVTVNGAVLVSPALDYTMINSSISNLIAAAIELPSYAASAAVLAGTPASPDDLGKVERFALGDYVGGLVGMTGLPPPGDPFIARVAKTIGLDEDTVRRERGRVPNAVFVRELRRKQSEVVSLYDGTVRRATRGNPWDDNAGDPILVPATAAFTAAFDAYAPDALGYHTELPYRVLPHDVSQQWGWAGADTGEGGLGLALAGLEQALLAHPQTKVLIVNGRTDLVTPYLGSRWMVDQLSLPAEVRDRIRFRVYDGGHMMYLRHDS